MIAASNVWESPFGTITTSVDAEGSLLEVRFGDHALLRNPQKTAHVDAQLAEYFAGTRRRFDLPISSTLGTAFQREVWALLAEIPYGETRTYGDLAKQMGRPGASRAVGRANATNPVAIVLPCHRVVGGSGSLTGYAYGTDLKARLLAFERGESDLFGGIIP